MNNTFLKCTKCSRDKPIREFSRSKITTSGRLSYCKACHYEYNLKKYGKRRICKYCKIEKELCEFVRHYNFNGYQHKCKKCRKEYDQGRYIERNFGKTKDRERLSKEEFEQQLHNIRISCGLIPGDTSKFKNVFDEPFIVRPDISAKYEHGRKK